jgi:hypothetical protein
VPLLILYERRKIHRLSRQKFVGCGFFLLLVGLAACVGVFALGLAWLLKIAPVRL